MCPVHFESFEAHSGTYENSKRAEIAQKLRKVRILLNTLIDRHFE